MASGDAIFLKDYLSPVNFLSKCSYPNAFSTEFWFQISEYVTSSYLVCDIYVINQYTHTQ